ncbi:MAG: hypothetical protein ISS81_02210 [Candidatus Marinimicrobia bacterium]|nr:hypothetical protein [Candidatus Neomarinimicrobiota bacterium]
MYKAILYKEWIKIKWVLVGFAAICLAVLVYIGLDSRHNIEMSGAIKTWLLIIQRKVLYYSLLKYIPLFAGIALAVAQFVPEMTKNRFRLSFHLPIDEKRMLLFMILIGLLTNMLVYILIIVGLMITGSAFYPQEIVLSSLITVTPWLLAGIAGYLAASMIVIESTWKNRIILSIISIAYFNLLFLENGYNEYRFSFWYYFIVVILFSITILFPGYRLRKGSK